MKELYSKVLSIITRPEVLLCILSILGYTQYTTVQEVKEYNIGVNYTVTQEEFRIKGRMSIVCDGGKGVDCID